MKFENLSRLLGTVLLVGGLAVAVHGCVDVLDLDGHQSAVQALCDQYNACFDDAYASCAPTCNQRLTEADAALRQDWLQRFSVSGCLDACKRTYECMDNAPFCGAPGSSCEVAEGCCGFLSGTSQCIAGSCCLPDGISCEETDDCCSSECVDGTCGGQSCKAIDEACTSDAGCCGDLRCSSERTCFACVPTGLSCTTDEACCDGICVDGTCGVDCQPAFTDCTTNEQCCSNRCIPISDDGSPDETFQCADDFCIDDGDPCARGDQCCSQVCEDGICGGVVCLPDDAVCKDDGDCCSTKCVEQSNQIAQCCPLPAEGLCAHDKCTKGSALDPDCMDPTGAGDSCIAAICAVDPYCCCQQWDDVCVGAVTMYCGGQVCPSQPPDG